MAFKSISKKRRGRRVSITISMSDDEEQKMNKRSKTVRSKDVDYREESETEEDSDESEEEGSDGNKGIQEDNEDKMYINENNRIRTRNPPKALANIMDNLTDTQIESLKDIGFGSFVGYKINRFPTALARWLLLNYDPGTSVLEAGDVKIKITSQTVHDIFGLPMGGKEIVELNQAKKTDEVIEEWRVQFEGLDKIKPNDVANKILQREDDAGRIFKLSFLVLFVTQMMESTKCGTVNQTFLTCIKKDTDIKKLDWCGYLLKCLKHTKTVWKGGLFNGPSTFLTVLYAQKYMPIVLKRSSTAIITKWTTRKLIMVQKKLISSHKKITKLDNDIASHEIIATESTPEKERMTKAKITAVRNAIRQSPVKVVNFGEMSEKVSDGISNTPKDAKVTVSSLENKLMMMEFLLDGFARDLEQGIQQHPGCKELENFKLFWKDKLLKRASQLNTKDKDMDLQNETQNNQEMEVNLEKTGTQETLDGDKQGASKLKDMDLQNKSECTDWAEHSKISSLTPKTLSSFDAESHIVKVVSTVKEPASASVIPANGTPTPSDVNINADKQQVSNQEPGREDVPLTFTRISAKLRLPPKKAKEQESTATATVKEPSSVLLLNDMPTFDLCLTPTPPEVILDTDTEPMLVNECVKENAKEQGLTNTTIPVDAMELSSSELIMLERKRKEIPVLENEKEQGPTHTTIPIDAVPLSFAMPNTTFVTPAKERKRKNFDKETISEEAAAEEESKKMKRAQILSSNVKSPFIERFVKLGVKCSPEEEQFFNCIFRATRSPFDNLFVTPQGFAVVRSVIESLYPGVTIHIGVINMWSQFCNFEERLRSPESMRRLFCHSSMISEKTLNETDSVKALTYFIDDMELVMKSANVDSISKIDLVFFPILLAKSHYYLLVFNLKTRKIEIIDNSKNGIQVSLDDRYGESFKKLRKLFIEYLVYSEHQSWRAMKKAVCERLEMSWRTEYNNTDCGIFMMRHMETYMGSSKNWKCGFKNEGREQQTQLNELRKMFLRSSNQV